ncbi:hypothetical protein J2W83_001998 [Pseudomonas hunanensis]|uniref:Uncharacterized protein n=1 Tax=Pseudomonas hunanensis TaxID=1247546 RepID=A0ACC6K1Z0_9PSED|nr:hypothetical protein [Pseudomonas hunanensis]MDR6712397.1 hypothetical protein [Pseudomonas hunanensis]
MWKVCCLLFSVSVGCLASSTAVSATSTSAAASTLAELNARGNVAAVELKRWYDSVTEDCGGPDKPGYLCSGITMRTTASSIGFLPWEPTDSQLEKGSVAFSWVRRDNNFGRPFGNQNGLILYPTQAVPEGKIATLNVLCTFPINANTNQRPTLQGCGPITGFEDTTNTCQALGVNTAQQWLEKYPQANNYRVCGWDLRGQPREAAQRFQTALQARAGMSEALWPINNEVLLPVWQRGQGGELAVHSFFYLEGEREALAKAQYDQIRYQQKYTQLIPIVRVTFPADKSGLLAFAYSPQDQAAGQPTPTPSIDFEDLALGQQAKVSSQGVEFQLDRTKRGVSDKPHEASKGLISGKHLEMDSSVKFVLEGAGRRLVTFTWGCNSFCGVSTAIAGEGEELSEEGPGEMRYGTKELIIDGPEVISVTVDTEEDDSVLVLDNLNVQQLPDK